MSASQLIRSWLPAAVALIAVSGCVNPFAPRVDSGLGNASPPPTPSSPSGVIRLFEWCWNNRSVNEYREIFTDDFRFQFAVGDTSGNSYRDGFSTREDELIIAQNAFVSGSATRPPATRVDLSLDPTLVDQDDSRVGKNPKWHRSITTQVRLAIENEDEQLNVQGSVTFFVVRGDSALIPDELRSRFGPDSTRWWIERWEDYTLGSSIAQARAQRSLAASSGVRGGAATARGALPASAQVRRYDVTFGRAKQIYR